MDRKTATGSMLLLGVLFALGVVISQRTTAPPGASETGASHSGSTSPPSVESPTQPGLAKSVKPNGQAAGPNDELEMGLKRMVEIGYLSPEGLQWARLGKHSKAFQNQFHVIEYIPNDNRSACVKISLTKDGSKEICWNEYGFSPYFQHSEEELRVMANEDAMAAVVLGMKLKSDNDPEDAHYFLQASRLSGKPGPLVRYLAGTTGPEVEEFEVKDLELLAYKYLMAVTADLLGYPFLQAPPFRETYSMFEVDEAVFKAMERDAGKLYNSIKGT